jgi:hypothetical protein
MVELKLSTSKTRGGWWADGTRLQCLGCCRSSGQLGEARVTKILGHLLLPLAMSNTPTAVLAASILGKSSVQRISIA